jgi:hypothetical protein
MRAAPTRVSIPTRIVSRVVKARPPRQRPGARLRRRLARLTGDILTRPEAARKQQLLSFATSGRPVAWPARLMFCPPQWRESTGRKSKGNTNPFGAATCGGICVRQQLPDAHRTHRTRWAHRLPCCSRRSAPTARPLPTSRPSWTTTLWASRLRRPPGGRRSGWKYCTYSTRTALFSGFRYSSVRRPVSLRPAGALPDRRSQHRPGPEPRPRW